MTTHLASIILAGGTSRRLGGVDKATLVLDGVTLLDRVLAAVEDVREVVVVGPPRPLRADRCVTWTLEDPPLGGPLAGLAAGVAALAGTASGEVPDGETSAQTAPASSAVGGHLPDDAGPTPAVWVLALACDLPHAASAVPKLLAGIDAHPAAEAIIGQDPGGRDQPLLAAYRLDAIQRALAGAGDLHNAPMRVLLARLITTKLPLPSQASYDVDTWHDASELGVTDPGREDEGAPANPPAAALSHADPSHAERTDRD